MNNNQKNIYKNIYSKKEFINDNYSYSNYKRGNSDDSSCSSSHIENEDSNINYISNLEDKIISFLNIENVYNLNEYNSKNSIKVEEKNNNIIWMLFYKKLFKSFFNINNKNKKPEFNELIFRINFVLNQKTINKSQFYDSPNKFNIVNTYNTILKNIKNANNNNLEYSYINCLKLTAKDNIDKLKYSSFKNKGFLSVKNKTKNIFNRTNYKFNKTNIFNKNNLLKKFNQLHCSVINYPKNIEATSFKTIDIKNSCFKLDSNKTTKTIVKQYKSVVKDIVKNKDKSNLNTPCKDISNSNISKDSMNVCLINNKNSNRIEPVLSKFYLNLNKNKNISKILYLLSLIFIVIIYKNNKNL